MNRKYKSKQKNKASDLLNSVIEIDEVEYLIDKDAAESIELGDKTVMLKRMIDGQQILTSIAAIKKSIRDVGIVDRMN